jgi:hypothetical protein
MAVLPHQAMVSGDDLVQRAAVDLAARGILSEKELSPDALVELRALRFEPRANGLGGEAGGSGAGETATAVPPGLDAKHDFLALAMARPTAARTKELAERLVRIAPHDRVVAVAGALAVLGQGSPVDPGLPKALLALDPDDALLATAAFRLAVRVGDADVAKRAAAAMSPSPKRGAPFTE